MNKQAEATVAELLDLRWIVPIPGETRAAGRLIGFLTRDANSEERKGNQRSR